MAWLSRAVAAGHKDLAWPGGERIPISTPCANAPTSAS